MKDLFNLPLVRQLASHLRNHSSRLNIDFDADSFVRMVAIDFDSLELTERSHRIFQALSHHLDPTLYDQHVSLLLSTLSPVEDNQDLKEITTDEQGVAGWMVMPLAEYVARHALQDENRLGLALSALKDMTRRFTAEFAIRPLLIDQPHACLEELAQWVDSPCHHVRRLVSEGTRPKLPWAVQLPLFIEQPNLVLPLLERLRNDESEYVRRSVANHLNDISKDQPALTIDTLKRWANETKKADKNTINNTNRQRLIKHAGRTLIKRGEPDMLAIIGFTPIDDSIKVTLSLDNDSYSIGDHMTLCLSLHNDGQKDKSLLIDYEVEHLRGRGQHISKVFKWKTLELKAGECLDLTKKHSFKPISTRRYYSGDHYVSVLINGQAFERSLFSLLV